MAYAIVFCTIIITCIIAYFIGKIIIEYLERPRNRRINKPQNNTKDNK